MRVCEVCGSELVRRGNEKQRVFDARRYCGHECVKRARAAESLRRERAAGNRKCGGCGKLLVRKVVNGVPEVITTFESRRFCSLACAGLAKRGRPFPTAKPLVVERPVLVNADTNQLLRDAVRFHGEEFLRALDEVTGSDASRTVPWTQWRSGT